MEQRHEISDTAWELIKDKLPLENHGEGRPSAPNRQILNGLLWRAATGCPWRDIPRIYGPYTTIYTRFKQWCKDDIFKKLFESLTSAKDELSIDSTSVKVHQHATGAKKGHFEC